ncbi:MAG: hypothetical protein ABJC51_08030, partial [Acidobacteriota bacterium]
MDPELKGVLQEGVSHQPDAGTVHAHRHGIDVAHRRQRRVERTISMGTVARSPAGLSSPAARKYPMA